MNLYVLRHAIAVEPGTEGYTDAARPLTREGERRLRGIAEAMLGMELGVEVVLTSPYVRARQTAERVRHALGRGVRLQETEELSPAGTPSGVARVVKGLRPAAKNLVLVGHEPNLSEFVSWLVAGRTGPRIQLKKGGLCKVSCTAPDAGGGVLEWLLTPRHLLSMV